MREVPLQKESGVFDIEEGGTLLDGTLIMLKNGKNRHGENVLIPLMNGKVIEATVSDSVFYDKEGARQND